MNPKPKHLAKLTPTTRGMCLNHPKRAATEIFDGDSLCWECCNDWVRGERITAREIAATSRKGLL